MAPPPHGAQIVGPAFGISGKLSAHYLFIETLVSLHGLPYTDFLPGMRRVPKGPAGSIRRELASK